MWLVLLFISASSMRYLNNVPGVIKAIMSVYRGTVNIVVTTANWGIIILIIKYI